MKTIKVIKQDNNAIEQNLSSDLFTSPPPHSSRYFVRELAKSLKNHSSVVCEFEKTENIPWKSLIYHLFD